MMMIVMMTILMMIMIARQIMMMLLMMVMVMVMMTMMMVMVYNYEQEVQASGPELANLIWSFNQVFGNSMEKILPGPEQVAQEEWQPMQEGDPGTL